MDGLTERRDHRNDAYENQRRHDRILSGSHPVVRTEECAYASA